MNYWFQDPVLKNLLPLATASAIKGLTTTFNVPNLMIGSNVFPEGMSLGPSVVDSIGTKCPQKRGFIVSFDGSEKFTSRVARAFEAGGFTIEIWSKALPEAPLDNVKECSEAMIAFKPDVIIAIGGGSVIDGAKAAWILYERPDITDLRTMVLPIAPLGLRKKAILAAVPTTSGTGSECTSAAVVHDTEVHRKIPLANPELMPDYAILVPDFTTTMPPGLTVGTGLDVLAHAMDAIVAPTANELTDAISLASIQMTLKYLPRAYRNGKDREARHKMLMAASMAGIGFGNSGAALTHSFGHSVGGMFEIHHGLAVGLFIPYVFQFYARVSDKYLDICYGLRIKGKSDEEKLNGLLNKFRDFYRELDVPLNIKDFGISEDDFNKNMDKLVLYAHEDISNAFSPRPITPAQCEELLRYAYEGKDVDF